jgi:cytochrome c oxidase assembly protein subunit 15
VAVLLVAVLAHRVRPRRRGVVGLAWALVALVAANAVLGGISVRVDLHPVAIQGHLLLALAALVVNVVLIARCSDAPEVAGVSPWSVRLTWLVACGTLAAIVAGTLVTGAGPHAGDETAPRLDLDIPSIARIHGVLVVTTIAIALVLAARLPSRPSDRRALSDALTTWLFVGALQAAIGYIQYFNDLPELLVGAHVFGAALLTLASTNLVLHANPALADGGEARTLLSTVTTGT